MAAPFTRGEIEAGRRLFGAEWQFLSAASSVASLPKMRGVEIAFVGRSNVGKSSLINALTGRHALARTSHTPGRTQELIFFTGPGKPRAGRHAGLRLCGGRQDQGQGLDRAHSRVPRRPRQPGAGLPPGRRPARPQGDRRRGAHDPRQGGGQLPGGADQGRRGQGGRARRPDRRRPPRRWRSIPPPSRRCSPPRRATAPASRNCAPRSPGWSRSAAADAPLRSSPPGDRHAELGAGPRCAGQRRASFDSTGLL